MRFDIVDYGIAGAAEWSARFGNSVFTQVEAEKMTEVIMFPGGTGARLKQNLVDRGLNALVSLIILGDVHHYETVRTYDLIFCDATHDEAEIRSNIPKMRSLAKSDAILICDDINKDKPAELVCELWGADTYYLTCESAQYGKMAIFTKGSVGHAFG